MKHISKERIERLLWGAQHEMVHGDCVPNIPEREALCELALLAYKMRDALEYYAEGYTGFERDQNTSQRPGHTARKALALWSDDEEK